MKIVDIRTTPLSYRCDPPYGSAGGMQARRGSLLVVHIKSNVVNSAHFGGLPRAELWGTGLAILQNSEVNVTIAEPDTLFASIPGPAIKLGQPEMFLVEFCSLCGIVGDECNMPDASHLPSSLGMRFSKARVLLCRPSSRLSSR